MEKICKISAKGEIVIPVEIRKKLGLKGGNQVKIQLKKGKIIIEPEKDVVEALYGKWKNKSLTKFLLEERSRDRKVEQKKIRSG
ncbi:AbrB/MazE/SpoVT family DNA-binding domain-containing protein [Thermosulfurimonas sp.]|uniref:AbrB/MazE/SpoVT family DNA-binding domain-containing protein n=1 Tax=Thermosulfurimonas sp. TaxID=2080236 RepID=UPI0025E11E54|nr:AbrB/MazE/SpoVT family DNA-binding domain-containing protein [Thermosulfurimonas sp.]